MLALDMMRYGTDGAQKNLDGRWSNHPMFANSNFIWIHAVLGLITWLLVIAVLIALVRWLWAKGDKERKGR